MRPLIVANWKMHKNRAQAIEWVCQLTHLHKQQPTAARMVLCPPFALLEILRPFCDETIALGGQDCHPEEEGAYTGDTSAMLLADLDCRFVVLGHSERRAAHHENNEQVARKAQQAQKQGLCPIICIGETRKQRDSGHALDALKQQAQESTHGISGNYVMAYEPIWAIGSGTTPQPQDIDDVAQAVNAHLNHQPATFLYGGSVTDKNARDFVASGIYRGLLVGGQSLDAQRFYAIAQACCNP
ncbi:MAG: triose-phosphate isomerase [Alphaproteobacteria bacterium GM202ARS2]|nr:triose-phosphate isomerase [Alphaproteobacteria bacterium GM202ARS2]